jgi:hypothetical protein
MILPPDDALAIHNAIPGFVTDGLGDFAFPCSTSLNIAIKFAGHEFSISPKDYVGAPATGTKSKNLCQSNIVGQQVGSADQWLLGDVFLKNVIPCLKNSLIFYRSIPFSIMTIIKLDLE